VIRLASPDFHDEDIAAVVGVLRSGFLVQGERVRELETQVARITGARHAVAVSSGTAALHLSLLALRIGPGDRVIVPAYTWPATANVVARVGAQCVFADIDPRTLTLSPAELERTLAAYAPVAAVIPVHAFGNMADMPAILEIARQFGAAVVEDAACALGAELRNRAAGCWGRLGCFSFHPRKSVTTGEGGAITCDSDELADLARALRNHGQRSGPSGPEFVEPGLNYRMTEFQAALGAGQLARLTQLIEQRRNIAREYDESLGQHGFDHPVALGSRAHAYQSYVALVPPPLRGRVPELITRLRSRGVEAAIGTHHVPLTTYWRGLRGFQAGDFPATDEALARAIAIPLHPALSPIDRETVVTALVSEAGALAGALHSA
jgi:perosamine synthetase